MRDVLGGASFRVVEAVVQLAALTLVASGQVAGVALEKRDGGLDGVGIGEVAVDPEVVLDDVGPVGAPALKAVAPTAVLNSSTGSEG